MIFRLARALISCCQLFIVAKIQNIKEAMQNYAKNIKIPTSVLQSQKSQHIGEHKENKVNKHFFQRIYQQWVPLEPQ